MASSPPHLEHHTSNPCPQDHKMRPALVEVEVFVDRRLVLRLAVPVSLSAALTVETLHALLVERDGSLQGCRLCFSWRYDEDVDILIESDAGLREALQTQTSSKTATHTRAHTVRLYVTVEEAIETQETSVTTRKRHTGADVSEQTGKRLKIDTGAISTISTQAYPWGLVRPLNLLTHEECIFFLEHLQVRNARATLRPDVTGRELSALKSATEFKALGIKLDHARLAMITENAIKSYAKSGLQQSIIDERRIMYAQKRARQKGASPLAIAYEEEDHDLFSILLKEEEWEDINAPVTDDGNTLLHLAAELAVYHPFWFRECLIFLVSRGVNMNVKTASGTTALHRAVRKGYDVVVELLLDAKANPMELDADSSTALHIAADEGHVETAFLLISHKANIETTVGKDALSPLHLAAQNGHATTVAILIENGANIEATDTDLYTPLHWAAYNSTEEEYYVKTLSYLISQKANIEARDQNRNTPLHLAAMEGNKECVSNLLSHRANINTKDNKLLTPLHLAAKEGQKETASLLIKQKAEINAVDTALYTPLHWAARLGHVGVVSLLISQKANLEAKGKEEMTPLHCAARKGHTEIAYLLLSHKANIEALDKDRSTPLHWAARNGHSETVYLLVYKKANINAINKWGVAPRDCTAKEDIRALLRRTRYH